MDRLEQLKLEAQRIIDNVDDDPQGRYKLRFEFYERYGHPIIKGCEGLGNSELAFLNWEIRRGVLNPLTHKIPGSEWWRSVNSHFLYCATLADIIHQSGYKFENVPAPVQMWLQYILSANEVSWYQAHNCSIIEGYKVANALAFKETLYEQAFINTVLYRLLFAQSMVEGVSFGLLGKIFANPRGLAVCVLTDIDCFYPNNYPLTKKDIISVMHKAHNLPGILENIFDEILILPELMHLYTEAGKWNKSPYLLKFIMNNRPVYPIKEAIPANKILTNNF